MTIGDIINDFRDRVVDKTAPYLWSNSELVNYANEAIEELCRECHFIQDDSSPMCTVTLQPEIASYTINTLIWSIGKVMTLSYDTSMTPVHRASRTVLDKNLGTWLSTSSGRPLVYVTDMNTGNFTLYPKPAVISYLNMTVFRYPLAGLSWQNLNGIPEIGTRHHRILVYGMMARALSKENIDTFDQGAQTKAIIRWEKEIDKIKKEVIDATYTPMTNIIPAGFF